jgi:hypothetical protein
MARKHLQWIFGIKERKFLALVRQSRENPHSLTVQYQSAGRIRDSRNEGEEKREGNRNPD